MRENFDFCLREVLKHEGGFVNHPKDPGGATNKGVTIATFRRYVKANATVQDLKNISDEQVAAVYLRHYWHAVRADDLPPGVDFCVFDNAVNAGPSRAIKQLQEVTGAVQDGRLGPATMEAARRVDPVSLVHGLCDRRLRFLRSIRGGSLWQTFGRGWQRRVDAVRHHALQMAS